METTEVQPGGMPDTRSAVVGTARGGPGTPLIVSSPATPTSKRPMPSLVDAPLRGSRSRPNPTPTRPRSEGVHEDSSEPASDLKERAIENAPPWLISAVVHMLLVIALGLVWYAQQENSLVDLNAIWSDQIGEQLDNPFETVSSPGIESDAVIVSSDGETVNDPFAAPPKFDVSLDGTSMSGELTAPTIGLALSGRDEGMKNFLRQKYGGNKLTQDAVDAGLAWLAKQQRSDGTWSLRGPYSEGTNQENIAAATAMAMLAFQGDGHRHDKPGTYQEVMQKAVRALLAMQSDDGNFWQGERSHDWMYCHAQSTIAICELYGMSQDPELKEPAQRAVDYCVQAQHELGGWRYEPRLDSDTSVTGWVVMALQSALMAKLQVPSPTLSKVSEYLDKVAHEGGSKYSYMPGHDPTVVMTAEALLCRQYLGWKQNDERLVAGAEYLLRNPINYHDRDVYYWYYATQTMHHMEGKFWQEWNRVMCKELPARQVKTGKEKGSWDALGDYPDKWANQGSGGRLYVTCLSIYMLEVYYRHLPIYRTHDIVKR